jgi:hypothetical protein
VYYIDLHTWDFLAIVALLNYSWIRNICGCRMTRRTAHRYIRANRIFDIHSLFRRIEVLKFQIGCHLTIIINSPPMDWGHTVLILNLLSNGSINTLVCSLKTALTFWGF